MPTLEELVTEVTQLKNQLADLETAVGDFSTLLKTASLRVSGDAEVAGKLTASLAPALVGQSS